jgi:pyruvate/2-oxoglutarate dehydrogenase complex dihydrolipoamide acyltransferase (E2) component
MTQIILPELGEGITEAELVCWNFKAGEEVSPHDDVAELMTDKAVFNVQAPQRGILGTLHYQPGQKVPVGAVLAELKLT